MVYGKEPVESLMTETMQMIRSPKQISQDVHLYIRPNLRPEGDKKFKCTCCGNSWDTQPKNFYKSKSILYQENNGHINICRDCIDKYYKYLCDFYSGNEAHAVEHICRQFDIFFHEDAMNATRRAKPNYVFAAYLQKINLGRVASEGSTYIDTIKREATRMSQDPFEVEDENGDIIKINKKEMTPQERFWGKGFSDDDYEYLEDQYEDWTTRCECKSKAQEEIFKRICFKQLEILKVSRVGGNTKDLDATFQNLLDTANLKPKQNTLDAMSEAQTFGTLLQKYENERPLPEIDEELKDVDKIGLYIDVFFRGHLAKMMGLKNALSNLYTKFIEKYTVHKPEYASEDDENEALFDAIFGDQSIEDDW